MQIEIHSLSEQEERYIVDVSLQILEKRHSRGECLSSSESSRNWLVLRYSGYEREVFGCIFLDTRHRIIDFEELFFGTVDGASVYPREIVKRVLAHNASSVVLCHNHPSGVTEPSAADTRTTKRITEALALVETRVLDHIIIGSHDTVSMAERGLV